MLENFQYLSEIQRELIFFKRPTPVSKHEPRERLSYAVGAALYMPAIRKDIGELIVNKKYKEVTTIVLDLEDAIGDNYLSEAIDQTIIHFTEIEEAMILDVLKLGYVTAFIHSCSFCHPVKRSSRKTGYFYSLFNRFCIS